MQALSSVPALAPSRAIRLPQVCELTGASRPTIWRWVRDDTSFPKPFSLSAGITAWDEAEIVAWLQVKKSQRGAA
jgi:prophage regulatory protein